MNCWSRSAKRSLCDLRSRKISPSGSGGSINNQNNQIPVNEKLLFSLSKKSVKWIKGSLLHYFGSVAFNSNAIQAYQIIFFNAVKILYTIVVRGMNTTSCTSTNSNGDFIQYMAAFEGAQNVINIDSSESEEIEIITETTVITENHRCDLCNQGEFLIDKLLRFGGLINEKYKFVCDKCDKNFQYKSELKEHSPRCKGPVCDRTKKKRSSISQNGDVSAVKELTPIICKICHNSFKTETALKTHTTKQHSNLTYTCEVCKAVFSSFQKFRRHCYDHRMQMKNYGCTLCNKRYNADKSLKKHMKKVHDVLNSD